MDKLYIVMPAYNEEENIEQVVKEWHTVMDRMGDDSRMVVVDDGSTDHTYPKLCALQKEYPRLVALTKGNEGHGATLLYGYQYALKKGADYIFQTDSDGQTLASEFGAFWKHRKKYDVIIGYRNHREDGVSRVFVTKVLKMVIWLIFGVKVTDANTPYRLMSRNILEKYIKKVPEKFNLSNVLLSVLFVKNKEKAAFFPITFRPRQGGVNSINIRKIVKIGITAVKDFKVIKKTIS